MRMVRRLLLLLAIAECGPNRHATVAPNAPASRRDDAAIEGRVIDAETGVGLEGATVVAHKDRSHADSVEISDRTGRFRLAVAAGRHHITAYVTDHTVDGGEIDLARGGSATVEVRVPHDVAEAAEAATQPACPTLASTPAVKADDIDAVIGAALARFTADPPSLADDGLLPSNRPLYVASDAGDPLRVVARSLPSGRFVLLTRQDLQDDAERRGTSIAYLAITEVSLVGDCATIAIAVRVATPKHVEPSGLCCCTTHDVYTRQDGRWVFKRHAHTYCA